ncbi:MAG TPA: hypothetical protein VER32_16395, partial [Pyrinomonadaceae bacterium]|nr:hypothetical protein [Pyrinomonadaceae bacterium]
MNCQTFATLAPELARGALVETGARDAARAHADACRPCAARLGDERALAGGLRTLARAGGEAEEHARVEAALLAAFRARDWNGDASRDAATTRAAEVTTGATVRSLRWFPRWAQGAAVAAASALLVFGLYGLFVKRAGVTGGER